LLVFKRVEKGKADLKKFWQGIDEIEMKEKTMFKIAAVCSLTGLAILFFISESISVKEVKIGELSDKDIGKEVRIIGRIVKARDTDKTLFLEVGQQKIETVSVVLFKEGDIKLKEGDYIELIGELDKYAGEYSIIANAVKIIEPG